MTDKKYQMTGKPEPLTVEDLLCKTEEGRAIYERWQSAGAENAIPRSADAVYIRATVFAMCRCEARLGKKRLSQIAWEGVIGKQVNNETWNLVTQLYEIGPIYSKMLEIALAYGVYSR